jgi:nucleoside-diphosphate-sugar epimerase
MFATREPGRRLDEQAFVANVTMAANVCNAVRETKCQHLIYISSEAVYPFVNFSIREDLRPSPLSLYGLMHLSREIMFSGVDGAQLAVLRLAQVYGVEDPHGAYGPKRMVTSALAEGRIVLYGTGEERRDHICVDDVVRLIFNVLCMRSRGTLNVASGRSVSFAQLAQIVRDACGSNVTIEHEPQIVSVMHRKFDTTALNAAFPAHAWTPLEKGVAQIVQQNATTQNVEMRGYAR